MIQPQYGVLQKLFADRVFRIPSYQRFYSWQRRQREDLFNDLVKLAGQGKDQHHFMATLVCYKTKEKTAVGATEYTLYDIVDGQQRLTTLILLLKCIELAMSQTSETRGELAKILVKRDGHLILLQTNNANQNIFNRFIKEGIAPKEIDIQTSSDRNLARAIDDCAKFVKAWEKKHSDVSLMGLILHRLGFVVHDTEDDRAVYTVFEVLNSRGLDVDWLDKTKSMLMGRAFELAKTPAAAEAELQSLQSLWGQIYQELAKEEVPGDQIVRVAATLFYGPGAGKTRSADDSFQQLRLRCDCFEMPGKISNQLLQVAQRLTFIYSQQLLGPVTEILHARMLAVAILSAKGIIDVEREKLLSQLERCTFRIYALTGKDSRFEVGNYVRLAHKIASEEKDTRTYNEIMSALHALGSSYPVDAAVNQGLVGKDCYDNSPEICRYVLWLYEEHLAQRLGAGATVDEKERAAIWSVRATDSVEHIFPQKPGTGASWADKMRDSTGKPMPLTPNVGRIGNLLLLPLPLNQEAQIKPFSEKKQIYFKHHLRMINEVTANNDWTLTEIEAREAKIVAFAKKRWADI